VSILSFFQLNEEVTDRWVNLPCPGRRVPSDDDDRKRWVAELAVSHISESAMTRSCLGIDAASAVPLFLGNAATERVKARGQRS
jgi:hypothetical protein